MIMIMSLKNTPIKHTLCCWGKVVKYQASNVTKHQLESGVRKPGVQLIKQKMALWFRATSMCKNTQCQCAIHEQHQLM